MVDREILARLIEKARTYVMSPEEKQEQRRSWIRGELMLEHPEMTYEEADRRANRALGL